MERIIASSIVLCFACGLLAQQPQPQSARTYVVVADGKANTDLERYVAQDTPDIARVVELARGEAFVSEVVKGVLFVAEQSLLEGPVAEASRALEQELTSLLRQQGPAGLASFRLSEVSPELRLAFERKMSGPGMTPEYQKRMVDGSLELRAIVQMPLVIQSGGKRLNLLLSSTSINPQTLEDTILAQPSYDPIGGQNEQFMKLGARSPGRELAKQAQIVVGPEVEYGPVWATLFANLGPWLDRQWARVRQARHFANFSNLTPMVAGWVSGFDRDGRASFGSLPPELQSHLRELLQARHGAGGMGNLDAFLAAGTIRTGPPYVALAANVGPNRWFFDELDAWLLP